MSEMRDLKKRRIRLENADQEKKCLIRIDKEDDIDEGFVDHGYEEGYFSLYSCDETSYGQHN